MTLWVRRIGVKKLNMQKTPLGAMNMLAFIGRQTTQETALVVGM
jgi:hypothetical protein